MEQNYLTHIDLFAGCGGLSLGLHNAGWRGLFAIEKSPYAFDTLEHNLIKKHNHFNWPSWLPKKNLDINQVLIDFKDQLIGLQNSIDLVTGGPPCQGFSTAGLRKENDVRNELIRSYLRFIMYVRPKMIFFENVKGFTQEFKTNKTKGYAYSQYVLRVLKFLKYDVEGQMVDFSEFGVPQKRTRFILVGIRRDIAQQYNIVAKAFFKQLRLNKKGFLNNKDLPQSPNLANAISDLIKGNDLDKLVPTPDRGKQFRSGLYATPRSKYQEYFRSGCCLEIPDSHSFPNHKPEIVKRFKYLLNTQVANKNISKTARKKYNIKKHTIIPLSAKHKAPTITTLPDDYIHYSEPRILTVREYARIQSFPDWFEIRGKYTTGSKLRVQEVPRYTQIGNAIPPLFSEQSGLVLKQLIQHIST
ncbi:DNA cytosine methyltransferase [Paraflavitalea pollutisoli]|uniref:DNA cytosine methyltransferase n=1 Tax=Paraflavitalea pollutisoli TaxID=3034143 RepID=UPI0023ED7EB9|nr:DNA cytosine methyltransferase [Paraflavitalea sp. H1-2-19X]